jgi:hypothetical protein
MTVAESFIRTLNVELIHTRQEAQQEILITSKCLTTEIRRHSSRLSDSSRG